MMKSLHSQQLSNLTTQQLSDNAMPHQVIHLVISLAHGGLERLVVDWTNARNRRSPGTTRVVCLDSLGELAPQVAGGSVSCVNAHRNRWPWDRAAVLLICHELETRDPKPETASVLHAHNLAAWQYAVLAKIGMAFQCGRRAPRGESLRLIYTQHGANVHNYRLRDRIRARLLACFTDEIVAVSGATADSMSVKLWIPRNRIRVVVNGVEGGRETEDSRQRTVDSSQKTVDSRQKTEVRLKYGISEQAFVIGSVGRLAQVKGYDRLIAAFAAIRRLVPPDRRQCGRGAPRRDSDQTGAYPSKVAAAERASHIEEKTLKPKEDSLQSDVCGLMSEVSSPLLLLTGDGPERENLERMAHELGIADQVIFAGYQADTESCYQAMDLFILPSRSEGLSISLLEAMAAGVPVMVTDVGANREVVEDGKCGRILPEDEGQWADAIIAAMNDSDSAAAKAQSARQRVRSHYSLETTLDGYEQLYAHHCFQSIPPS